MTIMTPLRPWPDLEGGAHRSPEGGIESVILREGFELILSDFAPSGPISCEHEEARDVVALGFHLLGGFVYRYEGEAPQRAAPLDCLIGGAPRGIRSEFTLPGSGFRTASIRLRPELAEEMLADIEGPASPLVEIAREAPGGVRTRRGAPMDAVAARALGALFEREWLGPARRLQLESAALGLLARQATIGPPGAPSAAARRRVGAAKDELEEKLDHPPSLAELARLCGTNAFTLKRDFKRVTGTTVFGHLRARRLERAAVRLRQGLSVQQAALEVGYACPSRFAHAFRRRYGLVPSALAPDRTPA